MSKKERMLKKLTYNQRKVFGHFKGLNSHMSRPYGNSTISRLHPTKRNLDFVIPKPTCHTGPVCLPV